MWEKNGAGGEGTRNLLTQQFTGFTYVTCLVYKRLDGTVD